MRLKRLYVEWFVTAVLLACLFAGMRSEAVVRIGACIVMGTCAEILLAYSGPEITMRPTRPDVAPGCWLIFLVPLLLAYQGDVLDATNLSYASLITFGVHIFVLKSFNEATNLIGLFMCCFPCGQLNCSSAVMALFISLLSIELLDVFPYSLTVGESILFAQLNLTFILSLRGFLPIFIVAYLVEHYRVGFNVASLGEACLLVVLLWPALLSLGSLFSADVGVLDLLWPLSLITWENILLVVVWIPMCLTAIAVVLLYSCQNNPQSPPAKTVEELTDFNAQPEAKNTVSSKDQNEPAKVVNMKRSRTPFFIRKLFHLLAGFVFFTGLLISPVFLSFASVGVFLAFLLVEWARRRGRQSISRALNNALGPFRDSRDQGEILLTPIALLLGLSLPIWGIGLSSTHSNSLDMHPTVPLALRPTMTSSLQFRPSAWSGVITIALGDSIAALVGRQWGGRLKWPGSHRTVLGSFASLLSQLMLWALLVHLGEWPWRQGILPLVAGVLAEAYTEQIDNLAVPLLVMTLFSAQDDRLTYR
uniref:dolichol kinase n=2 Tax=Schistocephalus solidus TaxID=70667 RepID=A0A0X3PQ97_SCHSO